MPQSTLGIAPPHRRADEVGVELVDRLIDQRLVVAGRPEQRVERQPAVDPAGGVARVERVRQRRHQVLGTPAVSRARAGTRTRYSAGRSRGGQPADQQLGEPPRLQDSRKPRVSSTRPRPTSLGTILRSSSHAFALRDLPSSRRAGRAARRPRRRGRASCRRSRRGRAGVLHPQHVVEQQVVAVGRGQALVRQAGRADQHLAQLAHLGVHAVGGGRRGRSRRFLFRYSWIAPVAKDTTPATAPTTMIPNNTASAGRNSVRPRLRCPVATDLPGQSSDRICWRLVVYSASEIVPVARNGSSS